MPILNLPKGRECEVHLPNQCIWGAEPPTLTHHSVVISGWRRQARVRGADVVTRLDFGNFEAFGGRATLLPGILSHREVFAVQPTVLSLVNSVQTILTSTTNSGVWLHLPDSERWLLWGPSARLTMGTIWYSACQRPECRYLPDYPLPLGKKHSNDGETRTAFPEEWITVSIWRHGPPRGETTRIVSAPRHLDILEL